MALKATVNVDWLKKRLLSKNLRILDARSPGAYSKAHIPRARNADLFHYLVPGTDERNLKLFHKDLESRLGRLGIRSSDKVVVYESGFGMRAPRVAWMLEYAGLKSPLILEGGFRSWRIARYPLEAKRGSIVRTRFRIHPNPKILATTDHVKSLSSSQSGIVLDVRSKGEYDGSENRDCCPRPGRVPNSVWLEWTNFLDGSGEFQELPSIKKQLDEVGVQKRSDIAVYCHRGARAAAAFYALRSMGYKGAKNYVGSWHEWSAKKNLPIETG